MANRFYKRASFLIILIFGSVNLIFAQSSKHVFSQKLEWKGDPNAIEYKVEIKDAAGKITDFKTEKTYIEFSFPSGDYEWRVTAYDFLGRASRKTEWEKFTIKKAIEPDVKTTEEKIIADDPNKISIPVQAEKVQPNAKIELVDSKTNTAIQGEIKDDTAIFEKVPEGDYKVRVTNPGGLSSETSIITVKDKAAEEQRIAEEKKRQAEVQKKAAEEAERARVEEKKRLEEEKRLAEENRIAEEKRAAEEKKLSEQQKKEEEKRAAEEKKIAEQQKKEEEKRAAEEKKLSEQQRCEEEKRAAEEKKLSEQQKKEEEKRAAEEKKLAEQQKKEEEKRAMEEKKLAEQQKKEEEKRAAEEERAAKKQLAKEKRESREPGDVYIMGGANAVINLSDSEIFLDKRMLIGADLKFEILPFSIGNFKLGFNIETKPTPLINKTSFIDEFMLFIPLNVNVSFFIPIIQNRMYVGLQAGGGAAGFLYTAKFIPQDDGITRDNVSNFYVNYMYDAGVVLRFYFGKRFVTDITAEFDSWRIGGYNLMNVLAGAQIGLRL